MNYSLAVIGVGNMAKSIIAGITSAKLPVTQFRLFDKNKEAYSSLKDNDFFYANSIAEAVSQADCVLISVKPQNYPEVIEEIRAVTGYENKLYISIGAGITQDWVSSRLGGAVTVRVLPNLPMTVGKGVSAICKNDNASEEQFGFVKSVFNSAGSVLVIDEAEMNRIVGVTSSSPAYVFKFIDAICKGAQAQGLDANALLDTVCDVVIGSAMLLKNSSNTPAELISRVASKGGTTQKALDALDAKNFDKIIEEAMIACTQRADELGRQ